MSDTDTPENHDGGPLLGLGSSEGLGLLPEREGQPRTLTMSMPWELERGHWYSPAAVREMLAAERAAKDLEIAKLREAGQSLVDAYRERYKKRSTFGIRAGAPMYREFVAFNAALQRKA